jgi:hypothetical protein
VSADTDLAEKEIPKFHALLDAGQATEIYARASEELRGAASEKDFVALLDAVHRKLGQVKTTKQIAWKVNYHTSGTFVAMTYKTQYAEGEATEQFVYRLKDKQAFLAGYHVNSNALIMK